MSRRGLARLAAVALCLALAAPGGASAAAPPVRLVVLKFDGLPPATVDRWVRERDPRTGRSVLPWIEQLFYAQGVRFESFYARGMSLSMTSWAILDSGRHGLVKGNWEVDRRTGEPADYLNYVNYYWEAALFRRVYPRGVEQLDAARIPLLSDAFQREERETSIQLLRRGTQFRRFLDIGLGPVKGPIGETIGDLMVGVDFERSYAETTRKSLLDAVRNPAIRYVDYYGPHFDHALHDDNDEEQIVRALRETDRIIGEAYSALVESGTADRTVFVVVSDHGATYDEQGRFSHGINLVPYLNRPEMGAHHVMTRRGPLANFSFEGSIFKPRPPLSTVSPSRDSIYLADRPDQVTCALDNDGNERVHVHLRSGDLNRFQMLHRALGRKGLDAARRAAVGRAAMAVVERNRAAWEAEAREVREELAALAALEGPRRAELARCEQLDAHYRALEEHGGAPPADRIAPYGGASALNTSDRARDVSQRIAELRATLFQAGQLSDEYGAYATRLERRASVRTLEALAATPEAALFGARELGANATFADLAAYPVGLDEIVLTPEGDLDEARSFATVDYFAAFTGLRVRNTVHADFGTRPVEFVVARLPVDEARRAAAEAGLLAGDAAARVTSALLVHGGDRGQLVLFEQGGMPGDALLALVPVAATRAVAGRLAFEPAPWRAGLPLGLFEAPELGVPAADRAAWLSSFHPEREWLDATHLTSTGLAVPGLSEVFSLAYRDAFAHAMAADRTPEERLARRLELRRRDAMEADLFLHASPHWHFNVKDFNPGANHGSFARSSMHAVLWLLGGEATRVRRGPLVVTRAYDGLDFAPTMLEAAGVTRGGVLPDALVRGGFRPFPGRIATEALED